MPDDARAGATDLLDGQLDPRLAAFITVVEGRDSPRHLRPFWVVARVVVPAVVGELLHASKPSTIGAVQDEIVARRR